jgi:hypothetical protein
VHILQSPLESVNSTFTAPFSKQQSDWTALCGRWNCSTDRRSISAQHRLLELAYWNYNSFVAINNMRHVGIHDRLLDKIIRHLALHNNNNNNNNTPWPQFASELYRSSDRLLSAKLVPTFADRKCRVVSTTDPYGRILGFLDRNRYFSSKLLLSCIHEAEWTSFQTHYFSENPGSAGNRTRTSGSAAMKTDH